MHRNALLLIVATLACNRSDPAPIQDVEAEPAASAAVGSLAAEPPEFEIEPCTTSGEFHQPYPCTEDGQNSQYEWCFGGTYCSAVSEDEGGPQDADGDGVLDEDDGCPGTAGSVVDESGCSIQDHCPCFPVPAWKNHGKYVSCVADHASAFVEMGVITVVQKGAIVSGAALSSCGK